jgi:hypothetical protein
VDHGLLSRASETGTKKNYRGRCDQRDRNWDKKGSRTVVEEKKRRGMRGTAFEYEERREGSDSPTEW